MVRADDYLASARVDGRALRDAEHGRRRGLRAALRKDETVDSQPADHARAMEGAVGESLLSDEIGLLVGEVDDAEPLAEEVPHPHELGRKGLAAVLAPGAATRATTTGNATHVDFSSGFR